MFFKFVFVLRRSTPVRRFPLCDHGAKVHKDLYVCKQKFLLKPVMERYNILSPLIPK